MSSLPRMAIGLAMDVVGSLVRQLTTADAATGAACGADDTDGDLDAGADAGRRVRHVVFLASGRSAAET